MEIITMTKENMWTFLGWSGGHFELSGSLAKQFETADKYPSMKEERAPSFVGIARLCKKFNMQPDSRKVIPIYL